ncbi:hypothetical protein [Colwellia sp. BRX8-9]|uniref:hypothetical protein n=1 Tax=Colwellia sp. BRX8-9 TaxID=2759831 RepID=UPI0015F6E287|nr:hypothetical protein [Colwellia sp. BRX8-9]MBA6348398.1 hypothetical protein [Colwellia sp. BRX8-9]
MNTKKYILCIKRIKFLMVTTVILSLSACGGSDSDSNAEGYVKLYNTTKNSPAIYLTIDEDFSTSDDDIEFTYNGVPYGSASNANIVDNGSYFYELAWQDGDSTDSSDLTVVYTDSIKINNDAIQLIVIGEDILAPSVTTYDIDIIDDEDDDTYDRFNFRVLNMHDDSEGIDVYLSKADETFNEANFIGSYSYQELSVNQKFDQDDYIFYITTPGSTEILFQSNDISFSYSSQYIIAIRENDGVGSSPYMLDKMSNSLIESFINTDSEAKLNAYNAIGKHDLLPDYQGEFSLYLNGIDDSPEIEALSLGVLSQPIELAKGDYSVDLVVGDGNEVLLKNHLLSLGENSHKTAFFYIDEVAVDDDGDGDVDEDGDGNIDEIQLDVHSLVVSNSSRTSIYDHEIKMVNLVDSTEFGAFTIYFVRSDETIESAFYKTAVSFANSELVYLKNNTYQVYVVAQDNSSEIILNAFELILDEESKEQFMVVEVDDTAPTGYKVSLFDQTI